MKAFVLAAGLGTRLKPFTLTNPKALVPVGGIPVIERVLAKLKSEGFDDVVINVHHFADKLMEYVSARDFGMRIRFSDERARLLDTGGGILHALPMLGDTEEPFLVHNVDIISNAPLGKLMQRHIDSAAGATLLVSNRQSSRKLLFDRGGQLAGWRNATTGEVKMRMDAVRHTWQANAFSGIHILSPEFVRREAERQQREGVFSIIDFYLKASASEDIRGYMSEELQLIDIGKPDTLAQAEQALIKIDPSHKNCSIS